MNTLSALTVSQLNMYVKMMLEADTRLKRICVVGEISGFSRHYKTGHCYFSLKDSSSCVHAVMFSQSAARLAFSPENGMTVYATGRVSVFERDGAYQLYVEAMEPQGAGALMAAFEQLKKKLDAEGLFDDFNKRPLPEFPEKIAVITSPVGAAVSDVINVISRRYPLAELTVYPVSVQGEKCAEENIKALQTVNERRDDELIILCRGGGSAEDLWGYNNEALVRRVAASEIPVITGIGHETDFTLCDFAADMRAPTPSAAAELAVPDTAEIYQTLDSLILRLDSSAEQYIKRLSVRRLDLQRRLALFKPSAMLERRESELDALRLRLTAAENKKLSSCDARLAVLSEKLRLLNPIHIMTSGFALVYEGDKRVKSVGKLNINDNLTVRFADGTAECEVKKIIRAE